MENPLRARGEHPGTPLTSWKPGQGFEEEGPPLKATLGTRDVAAGL